MGSFLETLIDPFFLPLKQTLVFGNREKGGVTSNLQLESFLEGYNFPDSFMSHSDVFSPFLPPPRLFWFSSLLTIFFLGLSPNLELFSKATAGLAK